MGGRAEARPLYSHRMARFLLLACVMGACTTVVFAQPAVSWLDPLVGVWDTEDTYYPVSGKPSVERGVRSCARVLHDIYLRCETIVPRPDGRGRSYWFLANYNATEERFEMLSLWSNVPHKAVQALTPDAERRRWRVVNVAVIGDGGGSNDHWSELVIESPVQIVWTGRRVAPGGDPATSPLSFLETWTKRP
jgi:hypothetical protein